MKLIRVGDIVRHNGRVKIVREMTEYTCRLSTTDYPEYPDYNPSFWWSEVPFSEVTYVSKGQCICAECEDSMPRDSGDYLCEKCRLTMYS